MPAQRIPGSLQLALLLLLGGPLGGSGCGPSTNPASDPTPTAPVASAGADRGEEEPKDPGQPETGEPTEKSETGEPAEGRGTAKPEEGTSAASSDPSNTEPSNTEPGQATAATGSDKPGTPPAEPADHPGKPDNPATGKSTAAKADSSRGLAPAEPERLFEGWPEPRFVFLLTGRQHGYIEPCGCTGLANQKGGLARRHRLQQQLRDKGWTVVPLDVGNQVRRFGRQAEIKFQMTAEAFDTMDYQAVTFGPDDIKLSTGELVAVTVGEEGAPSRFVSANIGIIDRSLTPTHRVLEVAGKTVGVTAVLGDSHLQTIQTDEIVHRSAEAGLSEVWPVLKERGCDLYVLLAHASIEETEALAAKFPEFDIVVTAGGAGEPTYQPRAIPGTDARMLQVGTKGMFAGVIGVFDDEETPIRYQRIPLDARFEDSRHMLQLLAAYQQQLENEGLEQLGVRPIPHPSGRKFVGSRACADCHRDAYEIWKETPHAHATDSLIHPGERSEIARHFDPECLSCHVTGWNAQKFFPYESGYLSLQATPKLVASGCENCHGPGSRHVAAERGELDVAEEEQLKLRKQMRLPYESARDTCLKCHDLDNSPDFHVEGAFDEYWEQVAH